MALIDRDVVLAADMTRAKVNELTGSQYEQAMKVALEVTLLTEEQRADIEQTVMVNLRAVAEELMEKHGESFAMIATAMLGVVCNSYVSTLASVFEEEKGLASTGPGCSKFICHVSCCGCPYRSLPRLARAGPRNAAAQRVQSKMSSITSNASSRKRLVKLLRFFFLDFLDGLRSQAGIGVTLMPRGFLGAADSDFAFGLSEAFLSASLSSFESCLDSGW